MANQSLTQWLQSVVTKAATDYLGQVPNEVIVRRSRLSLASGAKDKPTHKVRAWVQTGDRSYEVSVNVTDDGNYERFKIVE
jgi:hypothetical protein